MKYYIISNENIQDAAYKMLDTGRWKAGARRLIRRTVKSIFIYQTIAFCF